MTKAQKVRQKRYTKMKKVATEEATKIFDWILDLVDEAITKDHFGPVQVFMYDDESVIKTEKDVMNKYDLTETILKSNKNLIFSELKRIIDQEDGYEADLDLDATFWGEKAIVLKVSIS